MNTSDSKAAPVKEEISVLNSNAHHLSCSRQNYTVCNYDKAYGCGSFQGKKYGLSNHVKLVWAKQKNHPDINRNRRAGKQVPHIERNKIRQMRLRS